MENYNKCVVGMIEPAVILINPKDLPAYESLLTRMGISCAPSNELPMSRSYRFSGAVIRTHPDIPIGKICYLGGKPMIYMADLNE